MKQSIALRTTKLLFALCCFFAHAALARASGLVSVTLDPHYPADYSFYSFTATDGSHQSLAVAPYIATVNEHGVYTNQSAYVVCFDINNDDYVGAAYTGTIAYNSDPATLESTWLMNQLNISGLYNASVSLKGAISMAIWDIEFASSTKAFGSYFPKDPAAVIWETQAAQAVQSGSWTVANSNRFPTFIPDDATSQRYGLVFSVGGLATSEISSAPEASTWALAMLGSSLLAFGVYRRFKQG